MSDSYLQIEEPLSWTSTLFQTFYFLSCYDLSFLESLPHTLCSRPCNPCTFCLCLLREESCRKKLITCAIEQQQSPDFPIVNMYRTQRAQDSSFQEENHISLA